MFKELKIIPIIAICLINLAAISGDTKILKPLSLSGNNFQRHEVISLDNEDNLSINGFYEVDYDNGLTVTVTYVADKNGYRAKYMFKKAKYEEPQNLCAITLKSCAG